MSEKKYDKIMMEEVALVYAEAWNKSIDEVIKFIEWFESDKNVDSVPLTMGKLRLFLVTNRKEPKIEWDKFKGFRSPEEETKTK